VSTEWINLSVNLNIISPKNTKIMGFSNNGMTSIRNNRSLQRSTKRHFREEGRSTLPTGFYDENDKSPSFLVLKEAMQTREIRVFFVFGILCVGLGLLMTIYLL
jgi:hypothetical protein